MEIARDQARGRHRHEVAGPDRAFGAASLGHVAAQGDRGEQQRGGQHGAGGGVVEQGGGARDGDDHQHREQEVAPAGDRGGEQLQREQGGDVGGRGDAERDGDARSGRGAGGARHGEQGDPALDHRDAQRGGELGVVAQGERVLAQRAAAQPRDQRRR